MSTDIPSHTQSSSVRQRSYSMPGSHIEHIELKEQRRETTSHSLDEAFNLLSKKKIGKAEIDEQSLLHRAADAGKVLL